MRILQKILNFLYFFLSDNVLFLYMQELFIADWNDLI
jgi:hypothetical protein